jgi:multidrug resistance efflux pump
LSGQPSAGTAGNEDATPEPPDGDGASVTSLEPPLWRQLSDGETLSEIGRAWLALQCQTITRAARGVLLLSGATANSFEAAAYWPDGSSAPPALGQAAERALRERRGIATGDDFGRAGEPQGTTHVAFPILLGEQLKGVAAVTLRGAEADDVRSALRQLQWGVAWIRERLRQANEGEQERLLARSRTALDLLGEAVSRDGFDAAAMAVVTSLATRCRCTRVSIGTRSGNTSKIKAISHTAQFGRRMVLVTGLAGAMDEALDQRCLILYPAPTDQLVATSAHAELSRVRLDGNILTVPMLAGDRFVGAMTFERPADEPFEPEMVELLELATSIVGPVLEEKRRNDRWLVVKVGESLKQQVVRLLGPGHLVRKLVAVAIVLLALFLGFARGTYTVNADARIEGVVRRAVVAPYDGFIKEAKVRAGDRTTEGEVLGSLEDRDLLLERLKWVTERQQHLYEYDKALAAGQPAAINVIRAQMAQADAQIKLIDAELARIELRAPIAGLVVSGDLSQLIGTAVQRGQVLFEIAPLDAYRVILEVDERDVRAVKAGQKGDLIVTALPNSGLPFVVDKITPIAEAQAGRNLFRIEGRLSENPPQLRPGMEGIGKIEIGRRNLAWIWLHPVFDWLRIWSWRWE